MDIHQKDYNFYLLVFITLLFLSLNSIFCKAALINEAIDAYSFTFFRLFFGALTLLLIFSYKNKKIEFSFKSNWLSAFLLFLYAICFSFAYINIDAGFGALLLFGIVQLIMLAFAQFIKEGVSLKKLLGMIIAFIGLTYLLYPSHDFEVSYFHSFLMIISGIAWALYSILGKSSKDALFNTMDNFIKATIFIMIFYFFFLRSEIYLSHTGVLLAFLSGSITSALGYVLWYKIVPSLQVSTAGIIQLLVPIMAIFISVLFLDEVLSVSLVVSTILVCIGVLIAVTSKKSVNQNI